MLSVSLPIQNSLEILLLWFTSDGDSLEEMEPLEPLKPKLTKMFIDQLLMSSDTRLLETSMSTLMTVVVLIVELLNMLMFQSPSPPPSMFTSKFSPSIQQTLLALIIT